MGEDKTAPSNCSYHFPLVGVSTSSLYRGGFDLYSIFHIKLLIAIDRFISPCYISESC